MKKMLEVEIANFNELQEGDRYFLDNQKANPLMEVNLNTKGDSSFLVGTMQGRRRLSFDQLKALIADGIRFYGMREVEVEEPKPVEKNRKADNGKGMYRNGDMTNPNRSAKYNNEKFVRSGKLAEIAYSNDDEASTGKQLLDDISTKSATKDDEALTSVGG